MEEIKFYMDKRTGVEYQLNPKFLLQSNKTPQGKSKLSSVFKKKRLRFITPVDPNFSIVIPKIAANARIIPQVDPSNKGEYLAALKKGVAQAKGTAFPGENGHIFLFAHSTDYFWNVGRYNAIFYLLYKLEKGDEIDLIYKKQLYKYTVIGKEIVNPSQVEYLTRTSNKEFLTLQTCWPPGTTLKRILIFAVRKKDDG